MTKSIVCYCALACVLLFSHSVFAKDPLAVKVGGYKVDRVRALFDGQVKIEGVSASFHQVGIGDLNTEAFTGKQRYDITEIGLHPYILAVANDGFDDYQLLPIFPIRTFRHKSVFIRTDRQINKPEDLKGKKIATAGFSSTSLTWIRGFLEDEYGVKQTDITWVLSRKDSSADAAGKVSELEQQVPKGLRVELGPEGLSESDLLAEGLVDAVFHAAEPQAYVDGHPKIARLFPDSMATEQAYFSKTGIFPIMHALAVKKSLLRKHPDLAQRIFNAYEASKQVDFKSMDLGWAFNTVPWYPQTLERTRKTMGKDFWPYGIKRNKKALQTLLDYSYRQGLSHKKLSLNDLFGQYQALEPEEQK